MKTIILSVLLLIGSVTYGQNTTEQLKLDGNRVSFDIPLSGEYASVLCWIEEIDMNGDGSKSTLLNIDISKRTEKVGAVIYVLGSDWELANTNFTIEEGAPVVFEYCQYLVYDKEENQTVGKNFLFFCERKGDTVKISVYNR